MKADEKGMKEDKKLLKRIQKDDTGWKGMKEDERR